MRKLVYVFVTVLTCYMAGVFRSVPLMALGGMEAVLFAAAFLQSRYLKRHVSAEILRHWESIEKSAWLACKIKVKNTGKLPVSRFRIKLRYGYCREVAHAGRQKSDWRHIAAAGAVGSEKGAGASAEAKYIDGSCGQGESIVQMEITGRYCGIMTLHMTRLRVYDYLSLFSCARRMDGTVEVAVYPQEKALQLELSSLGEGEEGLVQERISNTGGEAGGEVRQLREYRSGDSSRYIHWNQTARTGQPWVKEYEREADSCIRLLLDMEGMEEADEAEADAFYELVSALVLGLLKQTASVLVGWHDRAGRMADMEVGNGEQCRELLLCLYRRGLPGLGGTSQTPWEPGNAWKQENGSPGGILKLDFRLGLYRNDTLLYTFSADNLEAQITGGKYVLDGGCCGL
ncbi:MAG TPA: hypothetical protein DCZ91_23390 [Lachnospiraceae bacterium]|nr:hypothetical protein [Lachnospiraceae bacterium]